MVAVGEEREHNGGVERGNCTTGFLGGGRRAVCLSARCHVCTNQSSLALAHMKRGGEHLRTYVAAIY